MIKHETQVKAFAQKHLSETDCERFFDLLRRFLEATKRGNCLFLEEDNKAWKRLNAKFKSRTPRRGLIQRLSFICHRSTPIFVLSATRPFPRPRWMEMDVYLDFMEQFFDHEIFYPYDELSFRIFGSSAQELFSNSVQVLKKHVFDRVNFPKPLSEVKYLFAREPVVEALSVIFASLLTCLSIHGSKRKHLSQIIGMIDIISEGYVPIGYDFKTQSKLFVVHL